MKNILVLCFFLFSSSAFSQAEDESRIVTEFIVMLKPAHNIDKILSQYPVIHAQRCLSKQMNIWLLERNTSSGADEFLGELRNNTHIKLAQFNHQCQRRSIVPNDTYFNLQWGLQNTGQNNGTAGADIDATEAWAINHNNVTATGDTVVIAIIDGTFDITHNDINFFVNHHETPNNGVDDDGNGFIDDYYGWNAYDTTGDINAGGGDPHAMHVSGIAGAIANDSTGIAGVCWGPQILRVAGSSGTEATVVAAYDYVIAMRKTYNNTFGTHGAFVVSTSSSFGVDYGNPVNFPIWCAMYDSMGAVGILSAAATANNPINVDQLHDIPTECPSKWLITVTNTTRTDHINGSAGTGKISIDLGAPGTNIYSTVLNNGYTSMTGTSMATPHLAGTVACMYSAACNELINDYHAYPDSIALLIKQMIMNGTNQISDLYNNTVSGGRLNLYHALRNLDEYNCHSCNYAASVSFAQPTCSNLCNGSAAVTVNNTGVYKYAWNTTDSTANLSNLCPGFYSVTVTDSATGCQRTQNFSLFKPDSIVISAIHTIAADSAAPGNITVAASAGNYTLQYSDNNINYQSASTLIVDSNSTYTIYVKSETGCVVQQSILLSGLADIAAAIQVSLSPNPATDLLNISLSASKNTTARFSVLNLLGDVVLDETKQLSSGIHNLTMDVSSFAAGFYFLRLGDPHSSIVRRFVVTK